MAKPKVDYIFIHTAAHGDPKTGRVYDTTAAEIDRWHRARGWSEIGYHAVVRLDGSIEYGARKLDEIGAHVAGMNSRAVGVCFSGHGDLQDLTPAQKASGARLVADWIRKFRLITIFQKNPMRVLGHREVNKLVDAGVCDKQWRTTKSCPGKRVDTSEFRRLVLSELRKG